MFTSKIWTDDSRLLQESNLTSRQPRSAPHHVIEAITSEGFAQGPYVAARAGFEPAIFRTEGTEHHHWATPTLTHIHTDTHTVIHLHCIHTPTHSNSNNNNNGEIFNTICHRPTLSRPVRVWVRWWRNVGSRPCHRESIPVCPSGSLFQSNCSLRQQILKQRMFIDVDGLCWNRSSICPSLSRESPGCCGTQSGIRGLWPDSVFSVFLLIETLRRTLTLPAGSASSTS